MIPKHIAIIMDGNRRFAKFLNKDAVKGHVYGEKKLRELIKWCKEKKIKELTVYALSLQNFNRPKTEFNYLMELFEKTAKNYIEKDLKHLKIDFVGRTHLLPENIQKKILKIKQKTSQNKPYKLNIAIAYGGREEIIDTIKKIKEPANITEEKFNELLDLNSEPDLVIRTGKEKRISNFLLWQISYSELIFMDKYWPEFTKQDFEDCLKEYSKRERRKGT
ncbi:MAG: polyprenyl diphosphate synthase [Candidatus Woesearchaeota archaeon]